MFPVETLHQLKTGVQGRLNDNTHSEPAEISTLNFFRSDSEATKTFSEALLYFATRDIQYSDTTRGHSAAIKGPLGDVPKITHTFLRLEDPNKMILASKPLGNPLKDFLQWWGFPPRFVPVSES